MARARTYRNERDVKARVKAVLNQYDWFWWMPPANGFGKVGIADFNALKDGVFMAIETKFAGNKPTPPQIGYLNSVLAGGGFAFVVDERTLPLFEEWLAVFTASAQAVQRGGSVQPEHGARMLDIIAQLTEDLAGKKPIKVV